MRLIQYIKDTRGEMKHVAWPTQKQTAIFTVLVIIISLLTAGYLGLFDLIFTRTLEATLGIDTTPGSLLTNQAGQGASATTTLPEGLEIETEGGEFEVSPSFDVSGDSSGTAE